MESCLEKLCSVASLAAGEDPIGTATPAGLMLLLEVALPWERELWKSHDFPEGLFDLCSAHTKRLGLRLHGIAPDAAYSVPNRRRLIILRRPAGPMAQFDREEYLLPPDQIRPLIGALLEGEPLTPFAAFRQEPGPVRDLAVCTHGSMDAACARFGLPIYHRLRTEYAGDGLRVWRVSHFGGHRFAATLLDLPEMRGWAHLPEEALENLVHRSGAAADLAPHYRGWGALPSPLEQVLEREALAREGWAWLTYAVASDVADDRITLRFRSPDGRTSGRYTGRVEASHRLTTVLATGREPESVPQYRATEVNRVKE